MKMILVPASKNIHAIGHDAQSNTLRVAFKSGGTYDYVNVPADVHTQFVAAESPGSFFHKHIRGAFTAKKIELAE